VVFEDYGAEAVLDNASAASAPERSQDNHSWHPDDENIDQNSSLSNINTNSEFVFDEDAQNGAKS
jgi:hypothetical protein